MLHCVVDVKKKYHPQTLLECKYEPKKIKMENLIDDRSPRKKLIMIMKLIMILMLKMNLTMRKIMMKQINNFLNVKKVF